MFLPHPIRQVPLPTQSAVAGLYASPDLADAFAIQLPVGASADPDVLWRFVMAHQPRWIGWLTNLRDGIVSCFGLKTTSQLKNLPGQRAADRIGFFKVYGRSDGEIVLGEDDSHLDFRLSVLRTPDASPVLGGQLIVSTVVRCHNLLGRTYIGVIAPFHRRVVRASLRQAARVGWPGSATPS